MPSINPFLSATKDDLDNDCRPEAIRAVRLAGGVPITMETWDTEYQDPIKVCCEKIQESSHYIGIFAYRRGWTPPVLQKSITEAEFDWAAEYEKPMVVFLPNPLTPFGLELRKRASNQTEFDSQAQQIFREKVMQRGAVQTFETLSDLTSRVAIRVVLWSISLRDIQAHTESKWRLPDETAINKLGRIEHEREFEDTLNIILRPNWPKSVCLLIHGSSGNGHSRLALRFRKKLETKPGIKQYVVAIGAVWRNTTLKGLTELIGSNIERNWIPESIEALAGRLKKMLEEGDVILEIANIQRLTNSLVDFAEKFWRPLVAALEGASPYRLIVLATLEETISPAHEQYLQPALKKAAVTFDPQLLIKLSELRPFEEEEVSTWLQNGGWLTPEAAQLFARVVIAETKGMPETLCLKLADDSTWAI